MSTFPIRFAGFNKALVVLGMGQRGSRVEVDADTVYIRMGWTFRARFDRANIASAALDIARVGGWGVHGWRGVWLLNGSSKGIVRIDLRERVRGYVIGMPVKVRAVRVSVEDPDALVAALA